MLHFPDNFLFINFNAVSPTQIVYLLIYFAAFLFSVKLYREIKTTTLNITSGIFAILFVTLGIQQVVLTSSFNVVWQISFFLCLGIFLVHILNDNKLPRRDRQLYLVFGGITLLREGLVYFVPPDAMFTGFLLLIPVAVLIYFVKQGLEGKMRDETKVALLFGIFLVMRLVNFIYYRYFFEYAS